MLKISFLLAAMSMAFMTSTGVSAAPFKASGGAQDVSFSVFFSPEGAYLSKEGRAIVSIAAGRFVLTHSDNLTARVFVSSEIGDEKSASWSNARVRAVGKQLVRDGVPGGFIRFAYHRGNAEPFGLGNWQSRRVAISIRPNAFIARS
jgi:hypothetical protein